MRGPSGRVAALLVATTALAVAVAALVVALTRNPSQPSAVTETTTTVASATPSVPPVGTLSVDGTGRPTLQISGYVRIPITRTGSYAWRSRLVTAPSSVLSVGGNPDAGGDGYRVVGTAVVRNYRSTWIGTFPKGHLIGLRVTFEVVSYDGKPFVELSGATVSGAPLATTTSPSA